MDNKQKLRICYAAATLLLLAIEVLIALFVRDNFVRPYIGDVLAVIVVYTFLRTIIPEKCALLPLFVFLFAVGVEVLQYFDLVTVLGLENNRFFSILLGSVFDFKDIICYAIGCIILGIYEIGGRKLWKRNR